MKKYPSFNDVPGFVCRPNPYGFRLSTVHPYRAQQQIGAQVGAQQPQVGAQVGAHCVSKAAAGWRPTADPTRPTDPTSPPAPTPDSTADPSCPTDSKPDPAEDPTGPTDSTPRLSIKLRPKAKGSGQLALTDRVRKLSPKQPAGPPPPHLLRKRTADPESESDDEFLRYIDSLPAESDEFQRLDRDAQATLLGQPCSSSAFS